MDASHPHNGWMFAERLGVEMPEQASNAAFGLRRPVERFDERLYTDD